MKNFQEKRKFKKVMQSKPMLILLGIVILVFAWSVFNLVNKMEETIKNKKIVEDKIENLQKQKEELLSDINQLKNDKGVEENIREKFGLAKDGEGMVVVVDDKNTQNNNTENKSNGFFSFLKNWFKK